MYNYDSIFSNMVLKTISYYFFSYYCICWDRVRVNTHSFYGASALGLTLSYFVLSMFPSLFVHFTVAGIVEIQTTPQRLWMRDLCIVGDIDMVKNQNTSNVVENQYTYQGSEVTHVAEKYVTSH